MIYEPNEIDWKIGDIVIHDMDIKAISRLAKIVEIKEDVKGKRYRVEFFKKNLNYAQWWHSKKVLHDPKRFNIDTSKFTTDSKES